MTAVIALTANSLRVRRLTWLAWAGAISLSLIGMLAIYPTLNSAVDYSSIFKDLPKGMTQAFGIEQVDAMSSANGFINAEMFGFMLPFAIVFLPLSYVNQAISNAEERGFLGLILSLPLKRWQLVLSAVCAGALALAVVLLVAFLAGVLTCAIGGIELDASEYATSCAALWPFASFFASIGLLAACGSSHGAHASAIAAGTLVAMYMINIVAGLSSSLDWLGKISLFHYYNDWLYHGLGVASVAAILAIAAAFTAAAVVAFERRDVRG